MTKLEKHLALKRYNEELKLKRQEYDAIGMVMCEKCRGTGIKSRSFKSIVECEECDGAGGFDRKPVSKLVGISEVFNDRYGMNNILAQSEKPHYRYNWKTGKAELVS